MANSNRRNNSIENLMIDGALSSNQGVALFISVFFLYEIGDGSKVWFWLDRWCGSSPLADCYLDLYRICQNKETSVADLMRYSNGVLHWEIHFCRDVHNQELEAFRSFIITIYSTPVRGTREDKKCWLPCKSKGFTVSAHYHLLVGHSDQFFPWKSIWKQKIPLEWLSLFGPLPWGNV